MTTLYTIQVSNHPGAGISPTTREAVNSWLTVYEGPMPDSAEAQTMVDSLSNSYRCARAFKSAGCLGKIHYAVLR
jgi:hypothetical protein